MAPNRGYPEFTSTTPFEITGPAPSSEPPVAFTPLIVSNGFAVSTSHSSFPSPAANARRWPSIDPENTTPGIEGAAGGCAGLQPGRGGSHGVPGTFHTCAPSASRNAVNPP